MNDVNNRVSHLVLIVSEMAQGNDILEMPTQEGGLLLDDSESDLLDLVIEITETIVPQFYQGNYPKFLIDFLVALQSAARDAEEDKSEAKEARIIDDLKYFVKKIIEDGRLMVA